MSEHVNKVLRKISESGGSIEINFSEGIHAQPIITLGSIQDLERLDFYDESRSFLEYDIPPVKRVDFYNNRVTKVTFWDGTFTKAICSENEVFNEDTGITICLMKKMLGKDGHKIYNRILRHVHETMERREKVEQKEKEIREERKKKQRKIELAKAAKKVKQRQEQIDIQSTAMLNALQKYHSTVGDDLK